MEETIRNKFGIKDKMTEKLLKISQLSNSESIQQSPLKRQEYTISMLDNPIDISSRMKNLSISNLHSNVSSIRRIGIVPSTFNQLNNRSISYGTGQKTSK